MSFLSLDLADPLPVTLKAPDAEPSSYELLQMILVEMRIMNQYLYELPHRLNAGTDFPLSDEPMAYRNDQTAFKEAS